MADALRGSTDAPDYPPAPHARQAGKHVVLGLILPKYIPDAFDEQHRELEAERDQDADPSAPGAISLPNPKPEIRNPKFEMSCPPLLPACVFAPHLL